MCILIGEKVYTNFMLETHPKDHTVLQTHMLKIQYHEISVGFCKTGNIPVDALNQKQILKVIFPSLTENHYTLHKKISLDQKNVVW